MALEVRHCQHALGLAEHGSFQRAAKALGISQPALSRSIQSIERNTGVRLFHRSRDGVEPTDAGRIFLARAEVMAAGVGDLEREMLLLAGLETGELRVGAGVYPGEMLVAGAAAAMHRDHPGIKLTLTTGSIDALIRMLKRRELDLLIGDAITAQANRELAVEPLGWHRGHVAVRPEHPLTRLRAPKLRDILRYPLAFATRIPADFLTELCRGLEREAGDARGAQGAGHRSAARALPAIGCDSPAMLRSIVAATDAVTLLPGALLIDDLERGRLATIPFAAPWLGRTFGVLHLAARSLAPSAGAFIERVRDADIQARERGDRVSATEMPIDQDHAANASRRVSRTPGADRAAQAGRTSAPSRPVGGSTAR